MAVKNPEKPPHCDQIRKILGEPSNLGWNRLGLMRLGLELEGAGIFRIDRQAGTQIKQQCPFYTQWKPRTANQIACAQFFKEGMAAWALLTPEQKEEYNKNAKMYHMGGHNLFMREWMRSF